MKRDEIERLKHNAKLDVRLPDQLKDEFLARCREEGVSSGAVIRSMVLDYVIAQPRRWPAMAAGLREMIVKRSRWIAGGIGGSVIAALAVTSVLIAPTASADDVELMFEVDIERPGAGHRVESTVSLDYGRPETFRFPPSRDEAGAYFYEVSVLANPCEPDDRCAADNVRVDVAITRHDEGGETAVAHPSLLTQYGRSARIQVSAGEALSIGVEIHAQRVNTAALDG